MESEDLLDFAEAAIVRVAQIATGLGVKWRKPQWGLFGGMLMQIDVQSYDELEQEKKLRKLLRDIEIMCTLLPKSIEDEYPLLEAIAWAIPGSSEYEKAEKNIRQGLYRTTLMNEPALRAAIRHIKRFMKASGENRHESDDSEDLPIKTDAPARYPDEINGLVSSILREQMCCTCIEETAQAIRGKHLTQLLLWPRFTKTQEYGQMRLDMLFSPVPVYSESQFDRWQNVELMLSWSKKKKKKKRARFSDGNSSAPSPQPSEQLIEVGHDQFCKLLGLYPDSRVRLVIRDGKFRGSIAVKPIEQIIDHKPGISLARILKLYSLTPKMRVALAYILAYSVWQYYDSDWIKTRWTSESIQFMKEYESENIGKEGKLFAWKPHLSVRLGDEEPELLEYSKACGEMHRYPKVRALGILLVEIGVGLPFDGTSQRPLADGTNDDWLWAMQRLRDTRHWEAFDYGSYRKAVDDCLNPENFFSVLYTEGDSPKNTDGLKQRRDTLYKKVVTPLEKLLIGTGWMEELTKIGPLDTPAETNDDQTDTKPMHKRTATGDLFPVQSTAQKSSTRSQKDAKKWLSRMNALNKNLAVSRGSYRPIKIAILDTGCDTNTPFFFNPENTPRLRGWKDFVDGSDEWEDHDGHGTYLTSLIMEIAPEAEIYVARITKTPEELLLASEIVAKAISWASNECNVDIISMSFGYEEEQLCISKAIYEALYSRNGSVLFFAAASNSGANERQMFPARHESVISVRATNTNGDFLDLNPPRDQNEGVVFGTLGLDVPSTSLRDDGKKTYKSGTSVATAVAAGIAGLLLGYASRALSSETIQAVKKLRTHQGMRALFRALARSTQSEQHLYLAPWMLEGESDEIRWSIIVAALFSL
ncbi:hypothetical protein ACHAQJ_002560 [Trichoderma viride]